MSFPHHRTVVSFLSPSAVASRIAQEKLAALLGWKAIATDSPVESAGLQCPDSGTILQWLSFDSQSERRVNERNPFRLLSVQEASSSEDTTEELQEAMEAAALSKKIKFKQMFWQPVTAKDLLGRGSLPLLKWKEVSEQPKDRFAEGSLKEIALPTFDDAQYSDGRTLREHLSAAPLHRPATGLYQLASGLCLRPLPTGVEDRKLPPPSLVFHANFENLPWVHEQDGQICSANGEFDVFKIGYNGIGKGQLMVRSADWWGIDLRFCEQAKYRAGFNEAQEALLAGSLPSLQSTHVLDGAQGTIDPRTDKMDCWVEFRASLRNPLGFWSRRSSSKPRIAKVPDIPYE